MAIRKLLIVFVAVAAAAFSPAPITEVHTGSKPYAEQSQQQIAKQQSFNGNVAEVGSVPDRVDEIGRTLNANKLPANYKSGDASVALGGERLQKASDVVAAASARVDAGNRTKQIAWWLGVIVLALGYFGGRAIVKKVERATPVPTFSKSFLKKIEKGKI